MGLNIWKYLIKLSWNSYYLFTVKNNQDSHFLSTASINFKLLNFFEFNCSPNKLKLSGPWKKKEYSRIYKDVVIETIFPVYWNSKYYLVIECSKIDSCYRYVIFSTFPTSNIIQFTLC